MKFPLGNSNTSISIFFNVFTLTTLMWNIYHILMIPESTLQLLFFIIKLINYSSINAEARNTKEMKNKKTRNKLYRASYLWFSCLLKKRLKCDIMIILNSGKRIFCIFVIGFSVILLSFFRKCTQWKIINLSFLS